MLQAYAVKDTTVIYLIQQDLTFKKMIADDVLGKIINHEMLVEEAQHVKNLSKGIISSRKQDITFKASKKSKSKKVVEKNLKWRRWWWSRWWEHWVWSRGDGSLYKKILQSDGQAKVHQRGQERQV
jgi:hypothetical protein